MPAVVIAIADAVVAELNGATLSQSFAAARAYVPVYSLDDDFTDLKVTVVPATLEMVALNRVTDDFTYMVGVIVQKRWGVGLDAAAVVAAMDALMVLVEEVMDLFRGGTLTHDAGAALCVAAANAPVYSHEHADEERLFTSVVRLTFKQARAR